MIKLTNWLQQLFALHWKSILKLILAVILFGFVFSKTSLDEIITMMMALPPIWILIYFLILVLHTMLKALQYWLLLKKEVDYPSILRIIIFQNAMASLISVVAGLASYLTIFKSRQKVSLKKSGAVFITIKIGDIVSIGLYTFLSAYILWDKIEPLHELIIIFLASIIFGVLLLWVSILLKERFYQSINRFVININLHNYTIVKKSLSYLEWVSKQDLKNLLKKLSVISLLSILYLSVAMLYGIVGTKIVKIPIYNWPVILIMCMNQILSYLPIHIFGGLGISEVSNLYLFGLFDVPASFNLPAALISLRVLAYLFYLSSLGLLGLDTLLNRKKSR